MHNGAAGLGQTHFAPAQRLGRVLRLDHPSRGSPLQLSLPQFEQAAVAQTTLSATRVERQLHATQDIGQSPLNSVRGNVHLPLFMRQLYRQVKHGCCVNP